MRKSIIAAALGAVAAMAIAAPASAAITFNLSNVQLVDGGSLTGWFTTSDDLNSLVDFSISSTSNSGFPYGTFVGRTYTKAAASTVSWSYAQGIFAIYLSPLAQLNFYFHDPLTSSGATLDQSASESQLVQNGGTRNVVSGSVVAQVAVPEPASWALMVGGFGLLGGAIRGRKVRFATA